jgi:DNA-binding beta-propeller fold protein YncE
MNNRIQRWNAGDSQGVTIAGNPTGTAGMSNLLFNYPNSIALNAEETYMFVADRNNHQIKMFELI